MRAEIEGRDERSQELQSALAALALDKTKLTDQDVRALCDHLAVRDAKQKCEVATASSLLEVMLVPRRYVIGPHVEAHLHTDGRLTTFIYGHTHAFERGWPLKVAGGNQITVHNTGAFQRTVDEAGFLDLVASKKLTASDALRKIKLEDLPPCYDAVLVTYSLSGVPVSKTWRWHQEEGGPGTLVETGDNRCKPRKSQTP